MTSTFKPHILVVEDEEAISAVIKYNLRKLGYNVHVASDGQDAIVYATNFQPELIVLDWMLPTTSGIEVCRMLRENPQTQSIPIIMLTAKSEEADKINALQRGADDYITKPFSPNELVARIEAVLRRVRPAFSGKILQFRDLTIDLSSHVVKRGEVEIELSPIEFAILLILMEQPGKVFSRETLMNKIWGHDVYIGPRTIDVHITRLRKTLMKASSDKIDIIRTVRLEGYALRLMQKTAAAA